MDILPEDLPAYDTITESCLKAFSDENKRIDPMTLAFDIMKGDDFPMHHPSHHYLAPAILLTCIYRVQQKDIEKLRSDLAIAYERSLKVLKGFCGFFGCCGAAVGLGIAYSVLEDTAPLSEKKWSPTNRITGLGLLEMSEYPGPRCCKRNTFIALSQGIDFFKEHLGLHLIDTRPVQCSFYFNNQECLKNVCRFYPKEPS